MTEHAIFSNMIFILKVGVELYILVVLAPENELKQSSTAIVALQLNEYVANWQQSARKMRLFQVIPENGRLFTSCSELVL